MVMEEEDSLCPPPLAAPAGCPAFAGCPAMEGAALPSASRPVPDSSSAYPGAVASWLAATRG